MLNSYGSQSEWRRRSTRAAYRRGENGYSSRYPCQPVAVPVPTHARAVCKAKEAQRGERRAARSLEKIAALRWLRRRRLFGVERSEVEWGLTLPALTRT